MGNITNTGVISGYGTSSSVVVIVSGIYNKSGTIGRYSKYRTDKWH